MAKNEATDPTHEDDLILVTDFVLASGHADTDVKDAAWRLASGLSQDAGEKADNRRQLRREQAVAAQREADAEGKK